MNLFFRVSGVVLTLLVFLGCGVAIGARRGATVEIQPVTSYRFQPLKDGQALDTKTGQICDTQRVAPPPGFTVDDPRPLCNALGSK